jgi:hypothetical protein
VGSHRPRAQWEHHLRHAAVGERVPNGVSFRNTPSTVRGWRQHDSCSKRDARGARRAPERFASGALDNIGAARRRCVMGLFGQPGAEASVSRPATLPSRARPSALRRLSRIHETLTLPPDSQKPRRGRFDGRRARRSKRSRGCGLPPVEPRGRRAGIEAGRIPQVLFPIHEDVDETVSHLGRSLQPPRMVPVAPHFSASPSSAIDRPREPNGYAAETAREGRRVVRLDDQVYVIGLHRKVHDAKPRTGRASDCAPQRNEHHLLAQARHPSRSP